MPIIDLPLDGSTIPTFVATPDGPGPWPGVAVVHDALGMTSDLRAQTRWLAEAEFVAAAPDLFHDGGHLRCLFRTMREMTKPEGGAARRALMGVRDWLLQREDSNGAVGIVGFCLGGGFAFALASNHGFSASAPNYGAMTEEGWPSLADACPESAAFRCRPTVVLTFAISWGAILEVFGVGPISADELATRGAFLAADDPAPALYGSRRRAVARIRSLPPLNRGGRNTPCP